MPEFKWSSALLAALAAFAATAPASAQSTCANRDLAPAGDTLPEVAGATLCELNAQRTAAGLVPLRDSERLDRSASYHAQDMAFFHFFAHRRDGGPAVVTRIRATGYFDHLVGGLYSENVADAPQGRATAAAVIDAWMQSDHHRATLLTGTFRDAGVGIEMVPPDSAFYPDLPSVLFVVDFGRRFLRSPTPSCGRRRTSRHKTSRRTVCDSRHATSPRR
jgi:uncharacterized protein YkwD